jgi:hypothetical protein
VLQEFVNHVGAIFKVYATPLRKMPPPRAPSPPDSQPPQRAHRRVLRGHEPRGHRNVACCLRQPYCGWPAPLADSGLLTIAIATATDPRHLHAIATPSPHLPSHAPDPIRSTLPPGLHTWLLSSFEAPPVSTLRCQQVLCLLSTLKSPIRLTLDRIPVGFC